MKTRTLITGIAALFLATGTAHAQRGDTAFWGAFSHGNSSGGASYVGRVRPINISPTTGRPYDANAPVYTHRSYTQRESKRR
jgi:hypothetical protein